MFWWISLVLSLAASWVGYGAARRFVRERLRYVESALTPGAPILAAVVTALLAAPLVAILPVVGGGTAIALGISVGLGVRAGASDVKRGYLVSSGS